MPVHHRLRFLTFPMRASRLCSLWPDMRPLRFRRAPFGRDVVFDPGGATASRIAMPHMLPSTVPSVSASAKFFLSWLNPTPHPITVYASHPPSPTTAQHSLPGGALPPYRGRSFTGRIASASPDAPEPGVPSIFAVNVLAAYILTALIDRPGRLVYVSSGTHHGVRPRMDDLLWAKRALGAAFRPTPRASFAMCCSPLPSLAAGKTSNPTRWSLAGCRRRWVALQPPTIFIKAASPGVARHERRRAGAIDRRVFLSSTAACAGLRAMSTSRRSCSQSAAASPVFL